jgi:signal transduction histidine kinase
MNRSRRRLVARLLVAYAVVWGITLVLAAFLANHLSASGLLAGLVAAGLVGVGLVTIAAERLTRPVRELTEVAEQVAAGSIAVAPRRYTVEEFDRLAIALDQMAAELARRLQEAEHERRLLEQVLAVVQQGVLVIGEDEAVVYANPAAEGLVTVAPRLSGISPHGLQQLARSARAEHAVVAAELERGSPARVLQCSATPFPSDGRVLLTVTDVTETSRVQSVRRDFAAAASHELKTPVATILASTEALRLALDRDPVAASRFVTQVETAANQLARLVADLLDLSRLETGEVEPQEVHLDQVVAEETERVRAAAEAAGLVLRLELEPVIVTASAQDLGLAVRNLLDNAIRHTPAGGSVTVRVEGGRTAMVTVVDTGEGIPRRELERIFERFYRTDSARSRATGGTGLGLAIVKHVAESHGGSVAVESELGAGSTFRLVLPVASSVPAG